MRRAREGKGKGMSKGTKTCHNMVNLRQARNLAWPKQSIRMERLERR